MEDTKKLAENHMKETIKLQQNIMELEINEVTEFNEWYKKHPYQQEMNNLIQLTLNKKSFV